MKIRMLTDKMTRNRTFRAGRVYDVTPGEADIFVTRRKLAEFVPGTVVETAAAQPATEKRGPRSPRNR